MNSDFLKCIFGDDYVWSHVTDFLFDPNNIPKDQHLIAWKGDYYSRYVMQDNSNQYFTISTFYADDQGTARRRKALYRQTHCIVLDDVREKLSMNEVLKLPNPSWILETSLGSEQWGYILNTPCTVRSRVENLLDGLVANGLAPDGKDPGMKGVTRYVRLPDGINNKASKLVNGQPFKCKLLKWSPFNTTTMEQLAEPFMVNLDTPRREQRVDGAAEIPDHPLLQIPDVISIKEIRSAGRFDITCPWVDEHTGRDDSGSAIFTNDDGSIGFKCHHGNCQTKTASDLMGFIESKSKGFGVTMMSWLAKRAFKDIDTPVVSFSTPSEPEVGVQQLIDKLQTFHPSSEGARDTSQVILKLVESLPQIEKIHWHNLVCDVMQWNKSDFKMIIKDLRDTWYSDNLVDSSFYDDVVFVKELDQFYDYRSRIFFTVEAFNHSYSHEDANVKQIALQEGRVVKVDKLDYAPKQPRTFVINGIVYGNSWFAEDDIPGTQGDVGMWLSHWDEMGWTNHRNHMLQWMAYTLLYPETKINHVLLLGSKEGTGKDFLLWPLMSGCGDNGTVISGEELLEPFNDYLLNTKYLHINETELGTRREAVSVSNKLKPIAAAPPETLRVNQKRVKQIKIRNIVNAAMTTNSFIPIKLNGVSRRFYATWSDLITRDEYDETLPEWQKYWDDKWEWMKRQGGVNNCIWYLRNCVDLSNFNPSAAPPMTDFLREIHESSKPVEQQTLEVFIRQRIGAFKSDLVTNKDAVATLRCGELLVGENMMCDPNLFNPHKVGLILRNIQGCVQLRARRGLVECRPWAIRNRDKYEGLSYSELLDEYDKQTIEARTANPITVVK